MTDPVVGVDYSYARPGGAALAAGGYRFAIRYLAEDDRGLTDDEVRDLHAHGVAIVAVYEGRGGEPLNGYEQGVADGAYAHRTMMLLGFPEDRPCYFAVDFDVIGAQLGPIGAYFRGVCASMGGAERVGVYGDTDAMGYLRQYGLARWFWQAMAPAWSQYKAFEGRHLYQYAGGMLNGGAIDLNAAYAEDYGQWAGEENAMPDPRVDDILRFLGGAEAVKRWLEKGNIGLIDAFTAEQKARGEATNAINAHIGEHPIGEHAHKSTTTTVTLGGVVR